MDGPGPYPTMKDSGVAWLGDVPAHWDMERIKNVVSVLFSNVDKHSKEEEHPVRLCNYSDVYYNDRIHSDLDFMKATATTEEIERFRLAADDVLITKDSEAWDDIGVPSLVRETNGNLICGYHLALLRPINGKVLGQYLYWSLSCGEVARQFYVRANGVTRFGLSQGVITSVRIPVPPVAEQAAIARFLDHATRRIDRYIRAKEKLIALLEEQKRAIINEAVTGRIDVRTGRPYPIHKDSGVEWLEAVPEHWDVRPAKWHLREVDERSVTGTEEMLSVSHLTGVTPRSEKSVTMFEAESNVGHKLCEPGDVVVNTMWAWMGALGIAQQPGLVSPSYAVYRPMNDSSLQRRYAEMMLRSEPLRGEFIRRSTGIRPSRLRLYPDSFLRVRLIAPPPEEQSAIIDFVARETARSDRVCRLMTEEVSALQEYRMRLVADVVTGKLDVRQAAELDEQRVTCGVGVGRARADSNSSVPQGVATLEETS